MPANSFVRYSRRPKTSSLGVSMRACRSQAVRARAVSTPDASLRTKDRLAWVVHGSGRQMSELPTPKLCVSEFPPVETNESSDDPSNLGGGGGSGLAV